MFIPESNIEQIYGELKKVTYYTRFKQTKTEVKIHSPKLKRDPRRAERDAYFRAMIEGGSAVREIKAFMINKKLCTVWDFSSKMSYYEEKYGRAKRALGDRICRLTQKMEVENV